MFNRLFGLHYPLITAWLKHCLGLIFHTQQVYHIFLGKCNRYIRKAMISFPLEVAVPLHRVYINFSPVLLLVNSKILQDYITCFQSNLKWKLRKKNNHCFSIWSLSFVFLYLFCCPFCVGHTFYLQSFLGLKEFHI